MKSPAKKPVVKTPIWRITPEQQIIGALFLGKVSHYYSGLEVMVLPLEASLSLGDLIRVKGHTTDLTQKIDHLQIDRENVSTASAGETAAVKVVSKVRPGDAVYRL